MAQSRVLFAKHKPKERYLTRSKQPGKTWPTKRPLFATPKPKRKPAVPEWKLQAAVISRLHKFQDAGYDFEVEGDMNAGKRNPARAKLTGIKAGASDIRLFFPRGALRMVEMKAEKTKISDEQIAYHKRLRELGFSVVVLRAKTEEDAVSQIEALMIGWFCGDVMFRGVTALRDAA